MTESEAIKICNTIGFAVSFSNPQGISLNTTKDELTEAMRMSIQALEKQILKKPEERDCIGFGTLACPVCKRALYLYGPYCDNCGQAIDWSDENEID